MEVHGHFPDVPSLHGSTGDLLDKPDHIIVREQGEDDRKPVSSYPEDPCSRPQRHEERSKLHKQVITGGCAVAVIHQAEILDIDLKDRCTLFRPYDMFHLLDESSLIGQTGHASMTMRLRCMNM